MFLSHYSITINWLARSTLLNHIWKLSNLYHKEFIAHSIEVTFCYLISKLVKRDALRHSWSRWRDGLQRDESCRVTFIIESNPSCSEGLLECNHRGLYGQSRPNWIKAGCSRRNWKMEEWKLPVCKVQQSATIYLLTLFKSYVVAFLLACTVLDILVL